MTSIDHPRSPTNTGETGDSESGARRKPSYVGLSCTVSGYSDYNRYTSPTGRKTSPTQIPVSSEPQTLDSVALVLQQQLNMRGGDSSSSLTATNGHDCTDRGYFSHTTTTRKVVSSGSATTVETVTQFTRSPDAGEGGKNLVQKQIERLYGNNAQTVGRVASPPDSGTVTPERKDSGGGFFAKRFGIAQQKDRHTANDRAIVEEKARNGNSPTSPLDFKPLKVPAVFRLLRPEFREQLKSNSCQIPGDQTSTPTKKKSERIIPIQTPPSPTHESVTTTASEAAQTPPVPKERVIPIQRSSEPYLNGSGQSASQETSTATPTKAPRSPVKPALPTKPLSPTPTVTSPGLVSQVEAAHKRSARASAAASDVAEKESSPVPVPRETVPEPRETFESNNNFDQVVEEEEEEEEIYSEDVEYAYDPASVGGVHERALLCTILEEDNESTASGSQLNLSSSSGMKSNGHTSSSSQEAPAVIKRTSPTATEGPNASSSTSQNPALEELQPEEEVQDGHYFIKLLENEIFKFEECICDFEEELNVRTNIPEEMRDAVFTAIGKAKLLMAQKLAQFRGLCDKNINLSVEEDPFVPTPQDLAGFWDMVFIQVEHIHSLFAELQLLKNNNWKKSETNGGSLANISCSSISTTSSTPSSSVQKSSATANSAKAKSGLKKSTSTSAGSKKKSSAVSEAAKARDEARKKMLEERKRKMKEMAAKKKAEGDNSDNLFVQF